jgi:hypothetical protein
LHRKAKATAALEGISLKELILRTVREYVKKIIASGHIKAMPKKDIKKRHPPDISKVPQPTPAKTPEPSQPRGFWSYTVPGRITIW